MGISEIFSARNFKNFAAIRPDRDIIGKQKNPRRKKLRREESSLPSPSAESYW